MRKKRTINPMKNIQPVQYMRDISQIYTDSAHASWVDRYRPRSLEDLVLPYEKKQELVALVEAGDTPHLLLYGSPGCGKTTFSLFFNPSDTLFCMSPGMIARDFVSVQFLRTCGAPSLFREDDTRRKVIVMDDADDLIPEGQSSLGTAIDRLSHSCQFILTASEVRGIAPGLASRCYGVGFYFDRYEDEMRSLMMNRCREILTQEHRAWEETLLTSVMNQYYPDFRKILTTLQVKTMQAPVSN